MGKDRNVGPIFSVALLASITIGAVYWTTTLVEGNDAYFDTFTNAMTYALDKAYGVGFKK